MIKALYTSITGMNAAQNALSVTSNNIANAQTVGYKSKKLFLMICYIIIRLVHVGMVLMLVRIQRVSVTV